MERIGIIDLGSNTTRLIVKAYEPHAHFHLIDEVRETVRLAEGVGEDNLLQPQAIYRTVEVMKMFRTLCRSTNITRIIAVGTSALRDAANQSDFLLMLKHEADLEMRVLSERDEAYYGYLGVVNSLPIHDGFVVDIGGGSTELSEVCGRTFNRWSSSPAGIVRFTERYVHSDPINNKDFRLLTQAVKDTFTSIDWLQAAPGNMLVGVGGTVRNLARIDQKRRNYPLERLHGYVLSRKALEQTITMLRKKDVTERGAISGLSRDRADVIVAGAVILDQLMEQGSFEEIVISGQGLREGLFYEYFLEDLERPVLPDISDVRNFGVQNLAKHFAYEEVHAEKVREISLSLFDQLQPLHGYSAWERELLGHAALLHDIGIQVGYYDHHKHSAYLLVNAPPPGFTHREVALLTILVRSHRKGSVKTDEYSSVLESDDEERACRLAALLRLGEDLERSKSQVVRAITVEIEEDIVRMNLHTQGDAAVELWNVNRKTDLFEKAFGRKLEVVGVRS